MLVALLAACTQQDYNVDKVANHGDEQSNVPDIEIEPDNLAFAQLDMGDVANDHVTITNQGVVDLHVTNMLIEGTAAFSLLTDQVTPTLAPGESLEYPIEFSPANPEDLGTLWVYSDDPDSPALPVDLTGGAMVPELRVEPNPYDFGDVLVGCSITQNIRLSNVGAAPLSISSIVEASDGYSIDAPKTPLTVAPGEYVEVPLTFAPQSDTPFTGKLWVTSNDLVGLTIAAHDGNGSLDGNVEEEFWQGDGPWTKTDIFFYVDQSGSMLDDRTNLTANFELFTALLASFELDWQIVVATRDGGCSDQGILTGSTADVTQAFLEGVDGTAGRFTEAGLTIAAKGMKNAMPGGCNEGFLRDESKTMLVLVSDEPEQSAGSWSSYVSEILGYAPTASITAIAGDVPYGCETADAGTGYYEAAAATGGAFLSICSSDWGAYFKTIASLAATGRTDTFFLSSHPDPASIAVWVDDAVSTAWTYDSGENAVVFNAAALPESGAHIVVDFKLAGDCDG